MLINDIPGPQQLLYYIYTPTGSSGSHMHGSRTVSKDHILCAENEKWLTKKLVPNPILI